ncbi:MAG: hypothetical protein J1F22_09650, partial [Lachnospiraceae bacterium]|nr:hypothetical protein [Lachnospiraceae bacterium]
NYTTANPLLQTQTLLNYSKLQNSADANYILAKIKTVCYNKPHTWRRIEVVITRTTRNRLIGDEPVRGFESHPLRQS